jgi:hypothetical protein
MIAKESDALLPGAELLRNYYAQQGDQSLAAQWHQRLLERQKLLQAAQQERAQFRILDRLAAHGLSQESLAQLIVQLRTVPNLKRAYLARKLTLHFPDIPVYVLGFRSSQWWKLRNRARSNGVQHSIRTGVKFPGGTLIVNLEASNSRFAKKLWRVKGAKII